MNTREAIQTMLDGKKVRPIDERVGNFEHCCFDGNVFIDHNKDAFDFNYWMSKFDDWELYEEPKKKEVVHIEKWLCQDDYGFYTVEGNREYLNEIHKHFEFKLLETYEVEL